MQRFRSTLLAACFIFSSATSSLAQEVRHGGAVPVEESAGSIWQPLIEIDSSSRDPFVLNESAAQILVRANNEIANKKLYSIQMEMAELITQYPSTRAGKEAAEMVEKTGLRVYPNGGLLPKETIIFYVPFTR